MSEAALVLAASIGLVLGALGGGGSILTVPAVVYGLGIDPKQAVAMSLPIVALSSIVGTIELAGRVGLCSDSLRQRAVTYLEREHTLQRQ